MNKKTAKLAENISQALNESNVSICAISAWKTLQQSKGRSKLDQLIEKIKQIRARQQDAIYAQILSARELADNEREEILQNLQRKMKNKIMADFAVDKKILGGLVIKTKDEIFDVSWKGKLEQLKTNLESA